MGLMTKKKNAVAVREVPATKPKVIKLQKVCVENGTLTIRAEDEAHAYLDFATGSVSGEFQGYCLTNLVNILPDQGQEDFTVDINAALAMLAAINPQNELEAMLAVQMLASNHMALLTTRRLKHSQSPEARHLNGNLS